MRSGRRPNVHVEVLVGVQKVLPPFVRWPPFLLNGGTSDGEELQTLAVEPDLEIVQPVQAPNLIPVVLLQPQSHDVFRPPAGKVCRMAIPPREPKGRSSLILSFCLRYLERV